jgi:hypothetical protein
MQPQGDASALGCAQATGYRKNNDSGSISGILTRYHCS